LLRLGGVRIVAYWVETEQVDWLQVLPISVNIISGVVGLCGGFLTLALVRRRDNMAWSPARALPKRRLLRR